MRKATNTTKLATKATALPHMLIIDAFAMPGGADAGINLKPRTMDPEAIAAHVRNHPTSKVIIWASLECQQRPVSAKHSRRA